MLTHFEVSGLNNKFSYKLNFNHDINIFTGKNGSGKTTLLKLMWYIMSGNIEWAIEEVDFEYAKLTGDTFSIEINRMMSLINKDGEENHTVIRIQKNENDVREILVPYKNLVKNKTAMRRMGMEIINEVNTETSKAANNSIFFPTFRRIEGGFTMSNPPNFRVERFEEAIGSVAETLSSENHQFITSVSTRDIVELLTRHYANISEQTNKLHIQLSNSIEKKINIYSNVRKNIKVKSDKNLLEDANKILIEIQNELNIITGQREQLLKPFNILSDLINTIFQHKGIKVTEKITLGEAQEALFSDKLSAGEKQMLSFICYNAFSQHSAFFIDEPEISLHVDWQRTLFPTLMSQSSTNQFFVATHSPFIYTKYKDKEILLHEDRGGF